MGNAEEKLRVDESAYALHRRDSGITRKGLSLRLLRLARICRLG